MLVFGGQMRRFLLGILFLVVSIVGNLSATENARAQYAGLRCSSTTDNHFTALFGQVCFANTGSGFQIETVIDAAVIPSSGTNLDVGIFTLGSDLITVNLGYNATNITLSTVEGPVLVDHQFGIRTTTADPINGTIKFDAGGNTFSFDLIKPANTNTIQAFIVNRILTPTVAITTNSPGTFNQSAPAPFTATLTFSEPVTGLTSGELVATNATVGSLSPGAGASSVFTATVTPTGTGDIVLSVADDVAVSAAGGENSAATPVTITQTDDVAPAVQILTDQTTHNGLSPFVATFEFSEDVVNFDVADVVVANGTIGTFSAADGNTYTADITPTGNTDITIDIAASVAQDSAGNGNTLANQTIIYLPDVISPTVQILNAPATHDGTTPFGVIFEFSEDVVNFVQTDVTLGNATLSNFAMVDGNTYTADITAAVLGAITIDIDAAVAQDPTGNSNTAATQVVVGQADIFGPTVQILNAPDSHDTLNPFNVTIEFSEDVQNFVLADITVGNGTASNFVAVDANTFTADMTPTGPLNVTVDVLAGAAQDLSGNDNEAATQVSVEGTIVEKTQEAIGKFLMSRAGQLLSSQPDLSGFVKGSNITGPGRLGTLSLTANSTGHALAFAVSRSNLEAQELHNTQAIGAISDALSGTPKYVSFQNKSDAARSPAATALIPDFVKTQLGNGTNSTPATNEENLPGVRLGSNDGSNEIVSDPSVYGESVSGAILGDRTGTWDVWAEFNSTRAEADLSESSLGVGYVGAHYFHSDTMILGVLGQVDWASETNDQENSEVNGVGWMFGPYIAGQLPGQNLFYEARFAYGQSDNEVSPVNTYVDSFDTTRWLASGKISGTFTAGDYQITPGASLSYFEETQESYIDSLANVIPEQSVSLGEFRFGPSFSRTFLMEDGSLVRPTVGVSGIYNYGIENNVASQGHPLGGDDVRARFDLGLDSVHPGGLNVSLNGFYDGAGVDDYQSYGGKIRFTIPLNQRPAQ